MTSDDVLMAEPISILFYSLVGTQALLIPSNLVGTGHLIPFSIHSTVGRGPLASSQRTSSSDIGMQLVQRPKARLSSDF